MPTSLESAVEYYVRSRGLRPATSDEYHSTVRKWKRWGGGVPIEKLARRDIREFLDWVYEDAVQTDGTNPGRTANKSRENLRAVMSWAWEQDMLDALPRFPKPRPQRDIAGRHYLTKSELNALFFATYSLPRPRGWKDELTVGHYWRVALVLFFNYGLDTGTIWKSEPCHEPILWRHVCPDSECPSGQSKERCRWGWIFYRRVKTDKAFYRPVNRTVHAHIQSIRPVEADPDSPVFCGGSSRPNARFRHLCEVAGIKPRVNIETGESEAWQLKDLRKTCATYYDAHMPESSVEILGHSVGGITYRHYAHRAPLAHRAIMTLPQPSAFTGLARGIDGECPCCRRTFPSSD